MADAESVAIAKAVTAALNAHAFSQSFTAVRSYADWDEELAADDGDLHVDVVVSQTGTEDELATRGSAALSTPIDIGVRRKFGVSQQDDSTGRVEVSEIDALQYLTQELRVFFLGAALTGYAGAKWKSSNPRLTFNRRHLRENRQYTAIIRLVFDSRVSI